MLHRKMLSVLGNISITKKDLIRNLDRIFFCIKKRDMPGDDSDFFDNVIEWKKGAQCA